MEWYVFAILSALFASLAPIADKKSLRLLGAGEFSVAFSTTNFAISLPIIFFIDLDMQLKTVATLYLGSLFATFAFLLVMKSMKRLPVSVVSPLKNLDPAILAILAAVILHENFGLKQIFGIIMIILGAYSLEIRNNNLLEPFNAYFKSKNSKFYSFIGLAGILYGFSSIIDKIVLSDMSPLKYILLAHTFVAFNFLILKLLMHRSQTKFNKTGLRKSIKWIFLASILTVSYRFLQAISVSMANVSLVIPIRHLSVLFTIALGGKLFNEKHLAHRLISAAIMLFGAWLIIAG